MMIRDVASFRSFVAGDGRQVYMRSDAFSGNLWVRVHKSELVKQLRIMGEDTFVAYRPRAMGLDIYCIGRKGLCETFDG